MNSNDSKTTLQEPPEQKAPSMQEIVEHFLGEVNWVGTDGYCKCPGEAKHTHATGKKDCKVFTGGRVVSVYCMHSSCHDDVRRKNNEIRDVCALYKPELPPEEIAAYKERSAKKKMLIETARALKPQILESYKWTMDTMDSQCPGLKAETNAQQWSKFLELYDGDDVLWCGEPESTGRAMHAAAFRRVAEWRYLPEPHFQFTCPSVFKRGVWSRSNANVVGTPYTVFEADSVLGECNTPEERRINQDACGAIFRWMRESLGMDLKFVLSSGRRSLHAWFVTPEASVLEELKVVLPELGVDRVSFKLSQPFRVPGGIRIVDDKPVVQRVLWRGY